MKELITRVEELAVQAARDARQIETLQGLLLASQSALEVELTEAIENKKKISELARENAELIVSECGHKKAAREAEAKYADSHTRHAVTVESRNKAQDEVRTLRAEVETLKHERDSAINECERLRAESKETIGDLRAQVDARLIERLSRQQAPLQVLYKELLSVREALGSKLRASVDKTTEALRRLAANETAQTKMHEGEVPKQEGSTEEP